MCRNVSIYNSLLFLMPCCIGHRTDYEVVDQDLGPFSAPGQRLCFNIHVNNACFFSLKMSSEDDHDVHISVPDTTVIIGTDRERCGEVFSRMLSSKSCDIVLFWPSVIFIGSGAHKGHQGVSNMA